MKKELIICIVIVVLVIIGNIITQNYTNKSVDKTSKQLQELREEIIKKDVNLNYVNEKIKNICTVWGEQHEKLAFYIEHDELEKVKTSLTGLKGYVEVEEYGQAVPELDKTAFILEHIQNKTTINLKNIF